MLSQLGWAAGGNLVAAGGSACFLRLLKSSAATASAGSAFSNSRKGRPFSTSAARPHVEANEARQEPADRAVASAKQHLKVSFARKGVQLQLWLMAPSVFV
jgi:hypothetical protein